MGSLLALRVGGTVERRAIFRGGFDGNFRSRTDRDRVNRAKEEIGFSDDTIQGSRLTVLYVHLLGIFSEISSKAWSVPRFPRGFNVWDVSVTFSWTFSFSANNVSSRFISTRFRCGFGGLTGLNAHN